MISIKKITNKKIFDLSEFGNEGCLNNFFLNFVIDKSLGLSINNYTFFKFIKHIKIFRNSHLIFQTNGLCIKSKIDLFYNMKYDFILMNSEIFFNIPIFLNVPIDLSDTVSKYEFIVEVDIDIKYSIFLKSQLNKIKFYNSQSQIIIKENQFQIMNIDPHLNLIKEKIKFDGIINHIILLIDGDIILKDIELDIYGINQKYNYDLLNKIVPYYYLNKILSKEYLYLCFTYNGQNGLNCKRIESFEISFSFIRNNGGKIYLISENKNIFRPNNDPVLLYNVDYKFDFENYNFINKNSFEGFDDKPFTIEI